jgi:ArpU family phage transcriptional regulator
MKLMAINEKKTIKNAKKKLREYPRWREIAHDNAEQRITANYTFEPRSKSDHRSNIVETMTVRRIDAMNELEAIEEAHRNIVDERYRVIIYRRFLQHPPAPNWVIGQELGYARTRFQELANLACLAFAENYRNGELVDLLE